MTPPRPDVLEMMGEIPASETPGGLPFGLLRNAALLSAATHGTLPFNPPAFRETAGSLPALGGSVGGTVGGAVAGPPGAMLGSSLLGAGGEAAREALTGENVSASRIAGQGIAQAGYELGGRAVAGTVSKLAAPLSKQVASALAARTQAVLQAADQKGTSISLDRALEALNGFRKRAYARGADAAAQFDRFVDGVRQGESRFTVVNPTNMASEVHTTAGDAHLLKQSLDSAARTVRDAKKTGTMVGPAERLEGQWSKALGDRLRGMLKNEVPGYESAMKAESTNLRQRAAATGAARLGATIGAVGALHSVPWSMRWPLYYPALLAARKAIPETLMPRVAEAALTPVAQTGIAGSVANLARIAGAQQ